MSRRAESENGCTSGRRRQLRTRRRLRLAAVALLVGIAGKSLAGDPPSADMQVAATMCAGCHAPASSDGAETAIPSMTGLSASVLSRMLVAFREGERENSVMRLIARAYSPEELSAIAAIIASPAPVPRNE